MSDAGTDELYLSRARLRGDATVAALAPLLLPEDEPGRAAAAHRLVWSLMTDGPDRARDFLWREEAPGRFMILSRRPPMANPALFEVDWQKFAPALRQDDRLHFVLRANPTGAHRANSNAMQRTRGVRHDVVMHALHELPKGERAAARPRAVQDSVAAWLGQHGARAGFSLCSGCLVADGYRQLRLSRTVGRPIVVASVECEGELLVTDPAAFMAALAQGFGRARAFGCGLMLIRRA
jgi:CRISPR system Cascade subunit CasE